MTSRLPNVTSSFMRFLSDFSLLRSSNSNAIPMSSFLVRHSVSPQLRLILMCLYSAMNSYKDFRLPCFVYPYNYIFILTAYLADLH
jgi:hypothetical protein